MEINWDSLWSSGLGALVGSAIALGATYLAHGLQAKQRSADNSELLQGVLQAIHDEVETLWATYQENMGLRLEALDDGQPLHGFWPVTHDYFPIYTSNSHLIGRIKDHELRKLIVSTYTLARGLIDSFRLNNDFVQKYELAYWVYQETQSLPHKTCADSSHAVLVQYAVGLKGLHEKVKIQISELLISLKKNGVQTTTT